MRTVEVWCNSSNDDPAPDAMKPALLVAADPTTTVADVVSKVEAETGRRFNFYARSSKSVQLRGSVPCPTTVLAKPSGTLSGGMLSSGVQKESPAADASSSQLVSMWSKYLF